jgi:hypothetical protein
MLPVNIIKTFITPATKGERYYRRVIGCATGALRA